MEQTRADQNEPQKRPFFKRIWFWVVIVVLVIGVAAAVISPRDRPVKGIAAAKKKVRYHCPMHPTYISDRPGECPICGMTLVPIKEEKKAKKELPGIHGLATVTLTPEKIQLIGVRTEKVKWLGSEKEIRSVGLVKADETRISTVNTKIEGWVEKLFVDFEGKPVQRGQPMLSIYSPELVSTQQEYLLALRARERLSKSPFPEVTAGGERLLEATRQRLLLWDISPAEIAKVEKSGQPLKTLTLYAPVSGFVTKKHVYAGMQVMPGMALYEVADLSPIWVEADIYEYEMEDVKAGQPATLTVNAFPNRQWQGRVAFIYPYLESQTRTLKVRFEFPNPGLALKPGMYANVFLKIPLGRELVVPFEAVMDTGERRIVFLDRGQGRFQPREVKLGDKVNLALSNAEGEDYYVVKEGLEEGDSVVTSGNFLIDSESRLKAATKAMEAMPEHKHGG